MESAVWYACVLELEARADGVIPPTHGQQVHGLFFELVRSVVPALSAELHSGTMRRPFTLSPLEGLSPVREGGHSLHQGQHVWLRATLLSEAVFGGFLAALLGEAAWRDVRLESVPFRICRVLTAPDQEPRAGMTRPARLLSNAGQSRSLTLRFATPTAFSLGSRPGVRKVVEPVPRPDLVFGSLLSSWTSFGGPPLTPALHDIIRGQLVLSRFRLESAAYRFRDHLQIGSVGTCTYDVKGAASGEVVQHLNALADAAPYLGVGYRTSMGMGQVRTPRGRENANDR